MLRRSVAFRSSSLARRSSVRLLARRATDTNAARSGKELAGASPARDAAAPVNLFTPDVVCFDFELTGGQTSRIREVGAVRPATDALFEVHTTEGAVAVAAPRDDPRTTIERVSLAHALQQFVDFVGIGKQILVA